MATRKSPDGKGIICDFSNVKCALHGVKLKECGCQPVWMDLEWARQRDTVRCRRIGRLLGRKHNERFLAEFLKSEPPPCATSTQP